MKKSILRFGALALMSLMSISTWAQNFKDEAGNYYQVTDKENLKVELLTAVSNISSVTIDKKSVRGKVKYDDKIYTITKIGNFAFANTNNLDVVDIPETVTELGYYALKNQTLRFADKTLKHLTSIGEYAFDGTTVTQLGTEIDFSAVCKLLPKGAFHNATFADGAVINMGKVTKLEDEIFGADEYTYDINAIVFSHAGMEDVLTEVGVGALKWRSGLTNFGYVDNGTYFLPKTLKTIGDFAFYHCYSLNYPNKIQFSAYAEGARITEVGEYAFQYCYIDDVAFKNLFKSFEGLTYSKGSFYGCSLTNIDLEKSDIKEIPEDAFNGNYNLTKLTLPAGCTKIGKNAFKDNSIAKITLPEGLVTVEEGGLLSAIPWGEDENIFSQDELCLPKSLKSIGKDGIGNRKIGYIYTNPDFVEANVPELKEQSKLTVKATIVPVVPAWVDNKVTKTSKSVYDAKGWKNVQYVSVLNSIGGLGYNDIDYGNAGAADESTGLIPIKVTNYKAAEPTVKGLLRTTSKKGSYTYNLYFKVDGFAETVTAQDNEKKAVKVTKITFSPKASLDGIEVTGYTAIPAGALANCKDLTAVALGDGIEEVGASAFANTKITEVTLPASLKTIGESAFAASTLKKVNVSYKAKDIKDIPVNAFPANNGTFTALLNVGEEATREDYLLKDGWKLFFDNAVTVNVTKNEKDAKEIRIATIDGQKGARIYQLKDAGDIAKVSVTGVPEKGAPKVQYIRDFKNTNFQAWYVPFDYTYKGSDDFKFYYIYDTKQSDFTADGNTSIELKEVAVGKEGTVIKANTPYVIQATAAKELTFEADAIQNTVGENKITVGNVQNQFTFTGIYARKTGVEKEEDWYALSGGKLDNYKGKTNLGVNAYRFYMTYEGQTNPYDLVKFVVLDDEDATAIENVKANSLNAPMFDLMGRQIAAPAKGQVYIQNGVKKLAK